MGQLIKLLKEIQIRKPLDPFVDSTYRILGKWGQDKENWILIKVLELDGNKIYFARIGKKYLERNNNQLWRTSMTSNQWKELIKNKKIKFIK